MRDHATTIRQRRLRALALTATVVILGGVAAENHAENLTVEPISVTHDAASAETGYQAAALAPAVADCHPDPATSVPRIVAAIFRCRLAARGWEPAQVEQTVSEALVVSWCESRWDPDVTVAGGAYLHRPHPRTGTTLSARGTWQFIRSSAEHWIAGGYAASTDPIASTHAAVDYYLAEQAAGRRGWEPWACAAANDGFASRSVLPGWPGGPDELPDWTSRY